MEIYPAVGDKFFIRYQRVLSEFATKFFTQMTGIYIVYVVIELHFCSFPAFSFLKLSFGL